MKPETLGGSLRSWKCKERIWRVGVRGRGNKVFGKGYRGIR